MLRYSKIKSPTFAINSEIAQKNIQEMKSKLPKPCTFRPHFKTHDNKRTAEIYKKLGVTKITVSSIEMAQYFRLIGFFDITIAFPVNIREHKQINKLAKNTKLGLTISNIESIKKINNLLSYKCDAYLEIDTGYNRSGIDANDSSTIKNCIDSISQSENLNFCGFLNHEGRTYNANSKEEIIELANKSIHKMQSLKEEFKSYNPIISIGDTPTCSLINDFSNIDEVRPGNFVYYDLMMMRKGVCSIEDIAATVLCPIVDINPDRNELVIHGGAVHFSKEFVEINDCKAFGKVIRHMGKETYQLDEIITSLSQEHGTVRVEESDIKQYSIGDLLEVIPVHSCLTANLMKGKTLHY